MKTISVIIHSISACNLKCTHCGQGTWRKDLPTYKLTFEQVKKFLDVCKESDYSIKEILISGGEPSLWKDLESSIKLMKQSEVVKSVTLFSNGTRLMSDEVIKNVNQIIVSYYNGSNKEAVDEMVKKCKEYGVRFKLKDKHKFWPWPTEKVEGTVPGQCVCTPMSLLGDEIAVCGQVFELERRFNLDCSTHKIKVENGFLDRLNMKIGTYDICGYCIENRSVQRKMDKVLND